jgi:hypothetical protein
VPDDPLDELMRFHREVLRPELREAIAQALDKHLNPFRDEMRRHFDRVNERLDRMLADPFVRETNEF